jgi:ubiquinone/menaquinone biosynthesis C-methylase UbiE
MIRLSLNKDLWELQYIRKGDIWKGHQEFPFDMPKGRVLELGCGNGKTVLTLMSAGIVPICLDISRNALIECAKAISPSVFPFIEGDVMALPFSEDAFDSIICFHVLEHLTKDERCKAVNEIIRVLKKGGNLYVQSFSIDDMRFGKGTMIEENTFERGDGIRYHYFRDGELENMFEGLSVGAVRHKVVEKRYNGRSMSRDIIQANLIKL